MILQGNLGHFPCQNLLSAQFSSRAKQSTTDAIFRTNIKYVVNLYMFRLLVLKLPFWMRTPIAFQVLKTYSSFGKPLDAMALLFQGSKAFYPIL